MSIKFCAQTVSVRLIVTYLDSLLHNAKPLQLVCQNYLAFFLTGGKLILIVLVLVACSVSPVKKISQQARHYGFYETQISTDHYDLLLIRNFKSSASTQLHVYLEGDGSPWFLRVFKSRDPTPRRAIMLELMSHDATPSIYLGRPCYNQHKRSPGCDVEMWTSGRYSAIVVESMLAAISEEADRLGVQRINLFGHSGGGTLAWLLAEKLPLVSRVITLAGNLNTDAWTEHHSLDKLHTSLNPALQPVLRDQVEQLHFVAVNDKNIPPVLVRDWIVRQNNSYGVAIDNYDHSCCWAALWPNVLQALQQGRPYQLPGEVFKAPD